MSHSKLPSKKTSKTSNGSSSEEFLTPSGSKICILNNSAMCVGGGGGGAAPSRCSLTSLAPAVTSIRSASVFAGQSICEFQAAEECSLQAQAAQVGNMDNIAVAAAAAAAAAAANSPSPASSILSDPDASNSNDDKDSDKDPKKKKNRCATCRKKVGLTGFECRCGGLFCAIHRYSDKHDCSFNYREMGAQEIRRNNPVVVGEKIQKI